MVGCPQTRLEREQRPDGSKLIRRAEKIVDTPAPARGLSSPVTGRPMSRFTGQCRGSEIAPQPMMAARRHGNEKAHSATGRLFVGELLRVRGRATPCERSTREPFPELADSPIQWKRILSGVI